MVTSHRDRPDGSRRRRRGWSRRASHLRNADPVLARLIADRPDFDPRRWLLELPPMDLFGALLFQVVGQQLRSRRPGGPRPLEARFGGRSPVGRRRAGADPAQFRDAGLSWRKVSTLRDLAERLSDGRLDPDVLADSPDDELSRHSPRSRG